MNTIRRIACGLLLSTLGTVSGQAEPPKLPVPAVDQSAVAQRGYFYVGGKYVGEPGKEIMQGQIYVEVLAPKDVRRPYPLVLIHGAAQTATNWMGTPDGRKGWAEYFVEQGYVVYMIDQPMRGRSAWHPGDGPACSRRRTSSSSSPRSRPTAPQRSREKAHAMAGEGPEREAIRCSIDGDHPGRDRHCATTSEGSHNKERQAGTAPKGSGRPSMLTHSQSGPFGWLIADARPKLVKGIIAIEPSGPPFEDTIIGTGKARAWGPTDIPMTYDPPVKDPSEIAIEREAKADGPDLFVCWMQKAPARQLVNLKNIPVMIMAAEASYHQLYDHCTAKYLTQAGMKVEWMPLQSKGIHGNGHMVMIEKNNLEIAKVIDDWAQKEHTVTILPCRLRIDALSVGPKELCQVALEWPCQYCPLRNIILRIFPAQLVALAHVLHRDMAQ